MFYIKQILYFIKIKESISINTLQYPSGYLLFSKIMKSAMFSNTVLISLGLVDETWMCITAHQKIYFPKREIKLF